MTIQDPLFLHEEIERQKADALRNYNDTIKQADEIAKRETMYEAARGAVLELQYLGYNPTFHTFFYSGAAINFSLKHDDHIQEAMNAILDAMEDTFAETEYEMNTDATSQDGSYYNILYESDGSYKERIRIEVYIASSEKCNQIRTQELKTVYTYVCDEED